jgi:hypothetical protein
LRILMLEPEQFSHDGPAFRTIVACEHRGGAQMQFFDCCKTGKSECLARDNNGKCQRGDKGKGQSDKAEALAAREQILDQAGDAKPAPSRINPPIAVQNTAPQRNPAAGAGSASRPEPAARQVQLRA